MQRAPVASRGPDHTRKHHASKGLDVMGRPCPAHCPTSGVTLRSFCPVWHKIVNRDLELGQKSSDPVFATDAELLLSIHPSLTLLSCSTLLSCRGYVRPPARLIPGGIIKMQSTFDSIPAFFTDFQPGKLGGTRAFRKTL